MTDKVREALAACRGACHPLDIHSDPEGLAIVKPIEPLYAAQPSAPQPSAAPHADEDGRCTRCGLEFETDVTHECPPGFTQPSAAQGKPFARHAEVDGRPVEAPCRIATQAPQPVEPIEPVEMSPEFTDTARAALLWVLWHHQGISSPVGQPLRFALGMGAHEELAPHQVAEAKRWAALTKSQTAEFHRAQPAEPEAVALLRDGLESARVALLRAARKAEALKRECGMNPESAQAVRNSEYMAVSYVARDGIARIDALLGKGSHT